MGLPRMLMLELGAANYYFGYAGSAFPQRGLTYKHPVKISTVNGEELNDLVIQMLYYHGLDFANITKRSCAQHPVCLS